VSAYVEISKNLKDLKDEKARIRASFGTKTSAVRFWSNLRTVTASLCPTRKRLKDVAEDRRWFARRISIQNCRSNLRATLCKDLSLIWTSKTAIRRFWSNCVRSARSSVRCSSFFVQDREDMLSEFGPFLDRVQANKIMIRLLNGGSIQENAREEVSGVDKLQGSSTKFTKSVARLLSSILKSSNAILPTRPIVIPRF